MRRPSSRHRGSCPLLAPPPPLLGPSSPPTRRRSGWLGGPRSPAHRSSSSPPFPRSSDTSPPPKPPLAPAQRPDSAPQCPSSPVLCACVVCVSCPSKHIIRYLLIHIPPPNSPRPRLSLPCPPHNIPPPAHCVRRVIRFASFRFARTLPSILAYIHRIPFIISPRPEPRAPVRCACRGGCDRMIAFSTVR